MHPLGRTFPRWGKAHFVEELRTKEQAETDRKVQESLDNFIRQTMGQEPYASLTSWPLLSPSKVQMQKCEKCMLEFCSPINYRRHIRIHRRSLAADNEDFKKERPNLATFWRKLTPEEASQIFSLKNFKLEDLSGAASVKALSSLTKQPGLSTLPQPYIKAGAALLDLIQGKVPVHTRTADELFSIMDNASEQTFLCGGTSLVVQRFVYHGDIGKHGLEDKNVVASVAFLLEHKLVKAWMVDKDAEALRFQKELVEEEEATQKRRQRLLERKRQKKLRQKGSKEKEKKDIGAQLEIQVEEGDFPDDEGNSLKFADDCESHIGSPSTSVSSTCVGQNAKHFGSAVLQLPDYTVDWDTKDAGNGSRDTKEMSQGFWSSSFYDGLVEGGSFAMESSHEMEKSPGDKSSMRLSINLYDGEVNIEDEMPKRFGSSADNFKAELDNVDEEGPQVPLEGRERNAQIQHRPNGGWKGNEYESYSIHSRNHEIEKSVLHRKNGRLTWERRSSGPFEKARIANEASSNEDRFRNASSRQSTRLHKNSYSTYTNITKVEQRPSSDFETATGPRFQHYRPKLRAKQALPNVANGYAVWTRKTEIPATLLDITDNEENCNTNNSHAFPEVDEAMSFLMKSEAAGKREELLEKDSVLGTLNTFDTAPKGSNSTTSMQLTPETPILLDLQDTKNVGAISTPEETSSPTLGLMKDTDGREPTMIEMNHDAISNSQPYGAAHLVSVTADSFLKDQRGHTDEERGDALIIGSLSIPLSNVGAYWSFHTIPQLVTENLINQQQASLTAKSSENWNAVVNARSDNFSEIVGETNIDSSVKGLEPKPKEANSLLEVSKLDEKEFSHSNVETNVTEKLAKQASLGSTVGRSGTAKVWRAVGFVRDKHGANALKSIELSTEEDTVSSLTGHCAPIEGNVDDVERQLDQGNIILQRLTSENLSSASVYGQIHSVHLDGGMRTNREIDEPGILIVAAFDENTAKNSQDQSSTFSSAAASRFLSNRWEAALWEVEGTSKS
ncbi:hypothetical protein O6H91_01G164300 [Diphasiastrum complanatum]|uniref:Uncharacterized protein n=1 Tax=Diphasiastrum complanatum TaxID=34168 RepID=A0ACC2EYB7_DIPCM|nr:hypothetical protein O6H91_01G164300 [Diphasiastrum complanatum]